MLATRKSLRSYAIAVMALGLVAASVSCAGFGPRGGMGDPTEIRPQPRNDENSRAAHAELVAKTTQGQVDIYFEGDSITRRWGSLDYPNLLANWKENFFGWNAADFAWGADTVQNILWRKQNGELDNVKPKIFVLLAGTNNVGSWGPRGDNDPRIAQVTAGIEAIIKEFQAASPEATIILTGIFPRNDSRNDPTGVMPIINAINANMAAMAQASDKIRYININDKLADADGKLYDGMTMDRLHPTAKGYQIWADALKPIFTEILGPPAAEDKAPPATGDPSAMARRAGTPAAPTRPTPPTPPARPAAPAVSVEPQPRNDQNSRTAHAELVAKTTQGQVDIYFEGDSITRRWGALDYPNLLANWKENFFGWNAADFAWGADTVQNILWRKQNGELDNVKPKIFVLLAGTNNVGSWGPRGDNDPRIAQVTAGIEAIIKEFQAASPDATIILTGIFPRNDSRRDPTAVMPIINAINANMAAMAEANAKIRYVNINDKLADADGKLYDGMTMDRLHPTAKGYQIWADALKPIFTEILGPPAAEDHAPPATGDPSAANRTR